MPKPARMSVGETLIVTTLLSIYLTSRSTALAIAAAQTSPSACARTAARVRERIAARWSP
jgi:hypothetical protein